MSTTGSRATRAAQRPPLQLACTLAPVGNLHPRHRVARVNLVEFGQAPTGCSDQRNGSPERQMLCRITASFLASAMRALPTPDRFAMD